VEIEYFISLIKSKDVLMFTRGQIIDYIAENRDAWVMVLKALLIKNVAKYVSKYYILEKLNFMKEHRYCPSEILDPEGVIIFRKLWL